MYMIEMVIYYDGGRNYMEQILLCIFHKILEGTWKILEDTDKVYSKFSIMAHRSPF